MKESRMEKGVHITISNDACHTERTHTVNEAMKRMRGGLYQMGGTVETSYGPTAIIEGYYWHPDDLIEVSPVKKPQLFHFDADGLVT